MGSGDPNGRCHSSVGRHGYILLRRRRKMSALMAAHITTPRLLALALLDHIFDEPEWQHIQKCSVCLDNFATLVIEANRERKTKAEVVLPFRRMEPPVVKPVHEKTSVAVTEKNPQTKSNTP